MTDWRLPSDLPPEGKLIEMNVSGDPIVGRHADGAWKREADGKSVTVRGWRLLVKNKRQPRREATPPAPRSIRSRGPVVSA